VIVIVTLPIHKAQVLLQGMANNVITFTFIVGDTTRVVYNEYWCIELVIVNTVFSVAVYRCKFSIGQVFLLLLLLLEFKDQPILVRHVAFFG
jgi:hypothetical protein